MPVRHAISLPSRLVFSYPIHTDSLFVVRNRISAALLDLDLPSQRIAALLHYIEEAADVSSPHYSTTACKRMLTVEWVAVVAEWAHDIELLGDEVVCASFVTAAHALYMTGRRLKCKECVVGVLRDAYVHVAQAAMAVLAQSDNKTCNQTGG